MSRSQGYGFDALGNFTSVTTDGVAQSRTANKQNEVTAVAGAVTPVFDAAGNMTGDEAGRKFTYDAWNRLVAVKSPGGVLLKSYAYDGTGRRVTEAQAGGAAVELYYSSGWQVLEERVGGVAKASYVWSPVYVDALVARDRDADGNSGNGREERLYALADANYNVTALVGVDSVVKERYAYDAFGSVTVLGAGYAVQGASGYGWVVQWQGMFSDAVSGSYKSRGRTDISPTLGRPLQIDPIGFRAGDSNFYRWEANSPTGLLDPSGLQPPPPAKPFMPGVFDAPLVSDMAKDFNTKDYNFSDFGIDWTSPEVQNPPRRPDVFLQGLIDRKRLEDQDIRHSQLIMTSLPIGRVAKFLVTGCQQLINGVGSSSAPAPTAVPPRQLKEGLQPDGSYLVSLSPQPAPPGFVPPVTLPPRPNVPPGRIPPWLRPPFRRPPGNDGAALPVPGGPRLPPGPSRN